MQTRVKASKYNGIYFAWDRKKKLILTKNITPGKKFFDENIIKECDEEYREFDPTRSKLAAAIMKKVASLPIKSRDKVLYLGAAHGYTCSFISDIIGADGFIFCVDIAPRVVRDLVFVCEKRQNMIPILADANRPETYKDRITQVDVIYQDIAQKNQVEILFRNLCYLKPRGNILIAIKARSIDVTKVPFEIFAEMEKKLKEKVKIIDKKELSPLQRDHMFFVCRKN